MTARNDITGDVIATKGTSQSYRDNYDAIFRKPAEPTPAPVKIVKEVLIVKEEPPAKTEEQLAREQADALRMKWWKWIEKHQRELDRVPSFEDWKANHFAESESDAAD